MKRAIVIVKLKHLPGQHDQQSHDPAQGAPLRYMAPKEMLREVRAGLGDLKKEMVFFAAYVGGTMFGARLYFKPTTNPARIKSTIDDILADTGYAIQNFMEHDLMSVGSTFYDDVTMVHIGPRAKRDASWVGKHLRGRHDQSTHNPYGPGSSVHQLRAHGGFTYQPIVKRSPTSGMALSLHPERELIINVDDLNVDAIKGYIERNKDLLSNPANNIGGWFDTESRKIFLDVSTVVSTREEAYTLVKQYKQEAFFDLGAMEEIRVGAHEPIVKAKKPKKIRFELPANPTQAELEEFVAKIKAQK